MMSVELRQAFYKKYPYAAALSLIEYDATTVCDELKRIDQDLAVSLLMQIPVLKVTPFFLQMEPAIQKAYINRIEIVKLEFLLSCCDATQRESIYKMLPTKTKAQLKHAAKLGFSSLVNYLSFPKVNLNATMTGQEALKLIHKHGEYYQFYYLTDSQNHLIGKIAMQDLLKQSSKKNLQEMMSPVDLDVSLHSHIEQLVHLPAWHSSTVLPVVDSQLGYVGVLTLESLFCHLVALQRYDVMDNLVDIAAVFHDVSEIITGTEREKQ